MYRIYVKQELSFFEMVLGQWKKKQVNRY